VISAVYPVETLLRATRNQWWGLGL